MTEVALDWDAIYAAVRTHLEDDLKRDGSAPRFAQVFEGEPLGLPPSVESQGYACFWYLGREDSISGRMTLANIMYAARIQVAAFWAIQPERHTLGELDRELADCDTSLRRRFRGDSTINSNITDLNITDSDVSFGGFPISSKALYRSLMFELRFENLEGEAISA